MAFVTEDENGKPFISNNWLPEDVYNCAKVLGETLTEDEVYEILHIVADGFDANSGICWENFYSAIEDVKKKKEDKNNEPK